MSPKALASAVPMAFLEASSCLPWRNRKSRNKGKGKDKSEKVDEKRILLLTHRCDGAILSDKCGDGLSAVCAQAVRRYIELRTKRDHRKQEKEEGKQSEKVTKSRTNMKILKARWPTLVTDELPFRVEANTMPPSASSSFPW